MPRDGLSPHKNLRRSSRDHSRLYSSLHENDIGLGEGDFEPEYRTRNRSSRDTRHNDYTRSGRKINHRSYYDGFDELSDEEHPKKLTYRQQMVYAINESTRSHRNRASDRNGTALNSEVSPAAKRKRVMIDDDDERESPENQEPVEVVASRRSTRRSSQPRSSKEPDDKDESPIRRSRRNMIRMSSENVDEEKIAENQGGNDELEKETVAEERNEDEMDKDAIIEPEDEEEDEDAKVEVDDEESSSTSSEEEEDQEPRQYSLRQRKTVVTFRQEQAAQLRRSHRDTSRSNSNYRRPAGTGSRHHRKRNSSRMRSDSDDTSGDDRRFDRNNSRKHLDRSRFMPINMTEKDIASVPHTIQERLRKTGAGQGSGDIDPMSIDSSVGFEQVGGMAHHIQSLKEVVLFPMLYPEVFAKFNINPPKGVVFYGPPGTGKTLVARALANECGKGANKVAFFMRKGADCLSKWVGESERQLRLLFDQAYAMRPSIIFFDEIDGLAPVRSSKQDQIHASIVSTLLALMDGLDSRGEVVVIGATNRLDTLDPALRRPGRFDRELRFSLPDLNARRQILDIHTSKWDENKPAEETLKAIADKTSGYCGADLKFLCTEAVLIALRCRYPHVYMSSERLRLDVTSIRVETEHFEHAMRRITPASRRDLTIPSRPLDERTKILIGDQVDEIIEKQIPKGYQYAQTITNTSATELEKVVRALEPNPTVPAVRLLICGTNAISDGGQTSYVLPAVLARLDHLPVFSLSLSSLLTDGRPEEAFSNVVQSVMRASNSGPCIMLLPSIDEWIKVIPVSVQQMLLTCLDSFTGFTPVLFLATLDSSFDDGPDYSRQIFRSAHCKRMGPAVEKLRVKYFEHLIEKIYVPPKVFDASKYIRPEVENAINAEPAPKRQLSDAEARELEKMYMSLLRQLRIFLRDRLSRFTRDRRFVDFVSPVEPSQAEDYYEIIKNPMCLEDMMEKLDTKKYIHADQFLSDIRLITFNALEYNPSSTDDGKFIRHSAIALRDVAEELIDSELDENFVEQLETTSRLMHEAGIKPEDEKLIDVPIGFMRKAPWSIKNSLANEVEKWKKEREKEARKNGTPPVEENAKEEEHVHESTKKMKKKRSRSYNFPGTKKRKTNGTVSNTVNEGTEEGGEEHSDGEETGEETAMEDEEAPANQLKCDEEDIESKNEETMSGTAEEEDIVGKLLISKEDVNHLIGVCIAKTEGWSVSEMERLASVISHEIEQYRDKWNRSGVPARLEEIVKNWMPYVREDEIDDCSQKTVENGVHNHKIKQNGVPMVFDKFMQ